MSLEMFPPLQFFGGIWKRLALILFKCLLKSNHWSNMVLGYSLVPKIFLIFYLFIFRERGSEGERKGEKHQCVVAFHAPPTGGPTSPTTQTCALTWNRTSGPLVHRPVLNPLSHTSQDWFKMFGCWFNTLSQNWFVKISFLPDSTSIGCMFLKYLNFF